MCHANPVIGVRLFCRIAHNPLFCQCEYVYILFCQHRKKHMMVALALYQPENPQNVGAMLRLAACFAAPVHVIEPCGFAFDDRRVKRVAMDYAAQAEVIRHLSWEKFLTARGASRMILLSTKADLSYVKAEYRSDDILLLGRESSGVDAHVREVADLAVTVPLSPDARSLNVTIAAAIVLSEALRQTGNT